MSTRDAVSVLVVDNNRKHLAWVTRILRTLAGTASCAQDLDEVETFDPFWLVVASYESMSPEQRTRLFKSVRASQAASPESRPHLLLLSSRTGRYSELFERFEEYGLTNLLAKNDAVNATDLIVTVQKILRRDIFGIEKYFAWGVEAISRSVRASSEREDIVALAESYAGDLGVHPRLVGQYCTVVDELLTNALYNAPTDEQGRPRFAHLPRSEPVGLEPSEEVVATFCCDGQLLGVSISDSFGALSKQRSLDYLAKCFRKEDDQVDVKEGGAGLGLYFTFDALSHFILNIQQGSRTELIGLLDVRGSYRDFRDKSKSFNIFVSEGN